MNNPIKTLLTLLSSPLIITLLTGSISFNANAVSCGDSIVSDTTLTAADVLTCSGPGLTINASNITLDCDFFPIVGSGTDIGIALDSVSGVTVLNCSVFDFAIGIQVMAGANQNTISRNKIGGSTSVGNGGIEIRSNGNVVQDNVSNENLGRGFILLDASGNYFHRNTAGANGFRGFDIIDSPTNFIVSNKATDNFSGGFVFQGISSNNIVFKNTSQSSGSEGFAIQSPGNFFNANRAIKNTTYGFIDSTGPANIYTNNKCINNGIDGSNPSPLCTPQIP